MHVSIERKFMKPIQVISIYRPPQSNFKLFVNQLYKFLCNIDFKNIPLLITGDINYDYFKIKKSTDNFLNMLNSFGLKMMINVPTRTEGNSSTCIDWVLCNHFLCDKIVISDVTNVSFSDHKLITGFLSLKQTPSRNCKLIRDFSNANIEALNCDLSCYSFTSESTIDKFFLHVQTCVDISVPFKTSLSVEGKNFLSKDYYRISAVRDRFYTYFKNNNCTSAFIYYKKLRKITNYIAFKDKKNYLKSILDANIKTNPKRAWQHLNNFFRPHKNNTIDKIKTNGRFHSDPLFIANEFSSFFISVVRSLLVNMDSNVVRSGSCEHSFSFFREVHCSDIFNLFNKGKPSSVDIYHLSKRIFNMNQDFFTYAITFFINKSLQEADYPSVFKVSKIIPVFKKGDKFNIESYRPISINSLCSKVFERVVYNQTTEYLAKFDLLSPHQFGFRARFNTESAFICLISELSNGIYLKNIVAAVFLDLTKAFDTLNHEILMFKLKNNFGFCDRVLEWYGSYLRDRFQFVQINNSCSSLEKISCGVPQGSILGPLLFNLYINDLPHFLFDHLKNINFKILIYADDICILIFEKDLSRLNRLCDVVLAKCADYFNANKLILNFSKTKVMLFNKGKINSPFKLNCDVEIVSVFKYLGYIIDDKLKFKSHVYDVCRKIGLGNYFLCRAARLLDFNYLKILFNSLVLPYLIYSKYVLLNVTPGLYKKVHHKILSSGSIIFNCSIANVNSKEFDLTVLLNFYFAIMVHKIMSNMSCPNLNKFLPTRSHLHNTRGPHFQNQHNGKWHASNIMVNTLKKSPISLDISPSCYKKKLKSFFFGE